MTKLCRSFSSGSRDGQCPNQVVDDTDLCERHLDMMSKHPNRCGSDVVRPDTGESYKEFRRVEGIVMNEHADRYKRAIAEAPFAAVQVPPVVDEDERTWAMSCTCHATGNDKHFGTCPMSKAEDVPERVGKQLGELDWHTERSLAKGTATRTDILAWHRQICEEARDLMVVKNRDYAADTDPLRNFKLSAQAAGISMAQCALVYLAENAAKYRSFIENGGKSASRTEKLVDHIRDSINFNILLYAILIDEGYFAHEGKK